jgi:hypothetical protein
MIAPAREINLLLDTILDDARGVAIEFFNEISANRNVRLRATPVLTVTEGYIASSNVSYKIATGSVLAAEIDNREGVDAVTQCRSQGVVRSRPSDPTAYSAGLKASTSATAP